MPSLLLVLAALLPLQARSEATVATGRHSTFLLEDGVLKATGRNNFGQLGTNDTVDRTSLTEVAVAPGVEVREVAAGAFHSLFLTVDGDVYAAGWNKFGQLATGDGSDVVTPQMVSFGGMRVEAVSAGYGHSLFLMEDGTVQAAGRNTEGQLGDGTMASRSTPAPVTLSANVSAISAGYDFSYFLTDSGEAWAVGQNLGGQLGTVGPAAGQTQTTPARVLTNVKAFAAGESHGVFVRGSDNLVLGTGANFDGQLGDSTGLSKMSPTEIGFAEWATDVSAAGDGSCFAAGAENRLYCTGSNRDGQLGLGADATVMQPTMVDSVNGSVSKMALADSHGAFLLYPGEVFVGGTNAFGELGSANGATTSLTLLAQVTLDPTTRTSTTTPPPTPAPPTPPTPVPTPAPTTTRGGNTDSSMDPLLIGGIGAGVVVLCLIVFCATRGSADGAEEPSNEAGASYDNDLELIRAEMSS